MYSLDEVRMTDPEIAQAIEDEQKRQDSHIELIASENWVSKAVMAAMGSPLTNKYAEGYPKKNYRIRNFDEIENAVESETRFKRITAHRNGGTYCVAREKGDYHAYRGAYKHLRRKRAKRLFESEHKPRYGRVESHRKACGRARGDLQTARHMIAL